MAVIVIKPGPDPSASKEATCRGCGAVLMYVPNDVKTYSGTDYSGGPDGYEWIDCPACNKKVVLKSW